MTATSGTLPRFDPPANQNDLSDPKQAAVLRTEWSNGINRSIGTAILGDPWTSLHDHDRIYYYNPLTTELTGGKAAPITWIAFPNRILLSYPNAANNEQLGYAEGVHADGAFGPPPPIDGQPYGPVGPRGWQDEYCEWISIRDQNGKITKVDFTCENQEYWFTLWRISPQIVLTLYRQLVSPAVQLADLYLLDKSNDPVIDRATGLPAYSPINKWNNQPSAGQTTGAVHLISPPNNLFAEIYLAAAATLLRENPPGTPVTDPGALIRCSRYGQPGRNSDPHIGASVNGIIRSGGVVASLENPVGLYIQMPDFSGYELPPDPNLPANAQASDCWHIVRGQETLPTIGDPNFNFILHATFEIPKAWKDAGVSFTVGDISIQGDPIAFGAQITQTFQIGLRGLAVPAKLPKEPGKPCVAPNPKPLPAPQQLQDLNLFVDGSTSAAVAKVEQGSTTANIVLQTFAAKQGASIQFDGTGVTAKVVQFQDLGGGNQAFMLAITVDKQATLGDRSLLLTNPDGSHGPAAPGLLSVVPPGTLGKTAPAHPHVPAAAAVNVPHAPVDLKNAVVHKKSRY
jgi:hypothetical protein